MGRAQQDRNRRTAGKAKQGAGGTGTNPLIPRFPHFMMNWIFRTLSGQWPLISSQGDRHSGGCSSLGRPLGPSISKQPDTGFSPHFTANEHFLLIYWLLSARARSWLQTLFTPTALPAWIYFFLSLVPFPFMPAVFSGLCRSRNETMREPNLPAPPGPAPPPPSSPVCLATSPCRSPGTAASWKSDRILAGALIRKSLKDMTKEMIILLGFFHFPASFINHPYLSPNTFLFQQLKYYI